MAVIFESVTVTGERLLRYAQRLEADGVPFFDQILALRDAYGLSFEDAKRLIYAARGLELEAEQGRVAETLDAMDPDDLAGGEG